MDKKIGIFVGSFDPFTIGHASIVRRALPLFDKIVIGVGVNEEKKYMYSAEARVMAILNLYGDNDKIEVKAYTDLTIDFAKRESSHYIIKGIRNAKDLEFEQEQAYINRVMGSIETILLLSEEGLEAVSSSMVRELMHFGKNVDDLLPKKNTHNNNDNI